MSEFYTGNAYEDGAGRRGWIVGPFIEKGLHATNDVEIKWADHPKGEKRESWVTDETRTALCMLIAGKYIVRFRDEEALLQKPGDYVIWGSGVDHTWQAVEDSTIMTIRWHLP